MKMCTDDWKIIELMYGVPISGSEKVEVVEIKVGRCARCGGLIASHALNKFEMANGRTVDVCIGCAIWLAHNAPEKEYFYSIR